MGSRLSLGCAELYVRQRIKRCVMVTRPQPDGVDGALQMDLDVLRAIHREREGRLAIGETVATTGDVAVGDGVSKVRLGELM
jgi:uncharacterized protein